MMQKKKSYAQMVKSNYKPVVSKKKQLEMKLLKENLANPARKRHRAGSTMVRQKSPEGAQTENETAKKKRKIIWKDNPMRPKTPERKQFKKIDYLKEAQIKKQEDGSATPQNPDVRQSLEQTWKKDLAPELSQ